MRILASHLTLVLFAHPIFARLLHSLPEDTYAFPKFRVAFLNSLPVLNDTAQRWLRDGLHGGELEFLDHPPKFSPYSPPFDRKGIESGQVQDEAHSTDVSLVKPGFSGKIICQPHSQDSAPSSNFTLELLKLGPRDSYVCLIPKPLDNIPSSSAEEQPDVELTPARSWDLLKPLTGSCLYVCNHRRRRDRFLAACY